eukprot:GHVS01049464.1.p1 GENE.GHVS01049464.1~~GHVS01049464.1.p1  ORF type:complete len:1036 (-),score=179.31 GHVS01049464.1:620-3727(-)
MCCTSFPLVHHRPPSHDRCRPTTSSCLSVDLPAPREVTPVSAPHPSHPPCLLSCKHVAAIWPKTKHLSSSCLWWWSSIPCSLLHLFPCPRRRLLFCPVRMLFVLLALLALVGGPPPLAAAGAAGGGGSSPPSSAWRESRRSPYSSVLTDSSAGSVRGSSNSVLVDREEVGGGGRTEAGAGGVSTPSIATTTTKKEEEEGRGTDMVVASGGLLEGQGMVEDVISTAVVEALSLPRLAAATLGSVTDLSSYLLLLSGTPASASSSFLSSFYNIDAVTGGGGGKLVDAFSGGFEQLWSGDPQRNVIIAYSGFRSGRPFEMFTRRNSFIRMLLEKLLEFLELLSGFSVGNIRTVYLRNVGMEIFQLPREMDLLGVGEFWRVLGGFPDYVLGVYADEELDGFDQTATAAASSSPPAPIRLDASIGQEDLQAADHLETDSSSQTAAAAAGAMAGGGGVSATEVLQQSRRPVGGAARELQSAATPNDPYYPTQWAHVDTGMEKWGVETPEAWKYWRGESTDEKLIVALIDSGVDYRHPDLRDNIWVNEKEICNNGIDDDNNGLKDDCYGWDFFNGDNDPMDDNGHGTASAGIIAGAANNGVGIAGICWGACQLMVLKALNHQIKGTVIGFIRAIDYAIGQGAKVSNNSYGGRGSSFAGLEEAVKRAQQAGMIFIAAAGNYKGNNDNDHNPVFPASYKLDNVISVAAVTRNGDLAEFSSYGRSSVDLAAPGQDIFSTTIGGAYKAVDGTSFAVPFVTGAAALMWTREPTLHYTTIIKRIKGFTKHNRKLEGKLRSSGVLDVYAAMTEGGKLLTVDNDSAAKIVKPTEGPIRRCADRTNLCGTNAKCIDSETEGPSCTCDRGFAQVGERCEDIDECAFEPCGPAATCKNLIGSFECSCRQGFVQVGDTCRDVDECSQTPPPCPSQAKCLNFVGNYDCVCPPMTAWNALPTPKTKCLTIRSPPSGPCVYNGNCSINTLCQSTGSWWFPEKHCMCLSGYVLHPTLKECIRPNIIPQQYPHYVATVQATLGGFEDGDGSEQRVPMHG